MTGESRAGAVFSCKHAALALAESGEPYRINKFACYTYRAGNFCSKCMRLCPPGGK